MDTLRVLVVDDEPGMRHSIRRALRDYRVLLPEVDGDTGFDVDQAESVAEAYEKIRAGAPDILLLDYKLGDGTGLDLLEKIHDQQGRILTVMVTAYATLETAIRATKKGAHDFLAKPFTPVELKETVRKAAEHFILERQARKLAEEKRQVRFQFIRVLGHELKAPLAAVEGFLHLVEQRCCGTDIASYDEIIQRCLARTEGMRKLIVDLLDLTRIEAGERQRQVAEVDLVEVARTSIETMTPMAEQRGITIKLAAPEALPMWADRVELEIVLNNLVSNAVKYNRDGGSAEVRLTSDDERVTIAVSDTGIGLSPEDAARLFNDFVRIKNDQTRTITGSGLGLSTVRKIAQLYGGETAVTSTVGQGSTFTVMLPHQAADEGAADDSQRTAETPAAGG